jgi:hypothetical protein
MKKLVLLVSIPALIGVLFCYSGDAFAEHTGPGKYTNEDLNKYETPGSTDVKTAPNVPDKTSNEKKSDDLETQDRDAWCRRGTPFLRAISEAQDEIDALNSEFSKEGQEVLSESRKEGRRDSATRKLREAESALSDLEDEAHEKGVPVGWVRCNFN